MSKQQSTRKVVLKGQPSSRNLLEFKSHQVDPPDQVWSNSSKRKRSRHIDHKLDRTIHLNNSYHSQGKKPPLLETPLSSSIRPQINNLGGFKYRQEDVSVGNSIDGKHSNKKQKNVQTPVLQSNFVKDSPKYNVSFSCKSVSNDSEFHHHTQKNETVHLLYDNQSFDSIPMRSYEASPGTFKSKGQGSDYKSTIHHKVKKDHQRQTYSRHSVHNLQFSSVIQDAKQDSKSSDLVSSSYSDEISANKTDLLSDQPIAFHTFIDNKSSYSSPKNKSRISPAAVLSEEPKASMTERRDVENIIPVPKSSATTCIITSHATVAEKDSHISEDRSNLPLQQQVIQHLEPLNHSAQPDVPFPNYPTQQIGVEASHQNYSLQNYSVHQHFSIPAQSSVQYIKTAGSYANTIHSPGPQLSKFINPYRCLVTPQYPILNLPVAAEPSFNHKDNVLNSATTVSTVEDIPPGNIQSDIENCQVTTETNFGHEETSGPEYHSSSKSNKKDDNYEESRCKRVRKKRPSTPKTHMKLDHLFSLIESIHDIHQLKAASNIVREIIRVLPLKKDASISWVDKETILHAIDELGEHLENHIKLQLRRSILRYGFQVINPDFVPDVTNTKCEIGDDVFSNNYKMSKGFVKETDRESDSGSDLEQSKRLVDSKYYSCWISRTYRRDVICMQRLSIEAKSDKGNPISFKGFKWGHALLTADLETSFVVRPENRVTLYQWLNKSTPSKPPKRKYETKPGQSDHVIMKVNLTKPKSGLKGLPQNLCECEFWEFNGTNKKCSVSYKYPKGMNKVTAFLAENHPLQPVTFDKEKLKEMIFDCD